MTWMSHSSDLDDFIRSKAEFFDKICATQHVLLKMVQTSDGLAAESFRNEWHIFTFDIFDDQDLHLGQIVYRQIADRIA
jgi:hypothetical protein